jgi:dipeptidase D
MNILKDIEPQPVFRYFEEISEIPRPSKKEEKIIAYLEKFAKDNKLKVKKDKIGNLLISKPASKDFKGKKHVILQGHVDMVCEKNSNIDFDFEKEGIKLRIENGWIKGTDTTLGADNGIAVAMMLALLSDKEAVHPSISCLFTVDEETGLTGASNIDPSFLDGDIMLNLDSENDNEIYMGCAGGVDTQGIFNFDVQKGTDKLTWFTVSIDGLKGGHSGDDIEKGRGNAIKILNRFLWNAFDKFGIRMQLIEGGNLRNAIPREAKAVIGIKPKKVNQLLQFFSTFFKRIKEEQIATEPDLHMKLEIQSPADYQLKKKEQKKLLNAIYTCPNGVMSMSKDIKGLVETSTNLASVKTLSPGFIELTTSQRSSIESAKTEIANRVKIILKDAGAEVSHSNPYPGWKPNTNSEILQIAKSTYNKMYGTKPKIKAIHAGLECGILLDKNPTLDIISIGPLIKDAHSPNERLNIESTAKNWAYLLELLKQIP